MESPYDPRPRLLPYRFTETPVTRQVTVETEAPRWHEGQRRTITVLIAEQIPGGIGIGASLSLGSFLAVQVSGFTAWSGMAATINTLGAAAFAIPLARAAVRREWGVSFAAEALAAGFGGAIAFASAFAGVLGAFASDENRDF